MTEAEARQLLRDGSGFGGLEAWISGRRWRAAPGGWTVTGELQGWSFRLEPVAGGLRIAAGAPGGSACGVGDRATGNVIRIGVRYAQTRVVPTRSAA